jgi:hypothetical protein
LIRRQERARPREVLAAHQFLPRRRRSRRHQFWQTDILIFYFYSEERNLLRKIVVHEKLGYKNIRISGIYAAQH